MDDNLSPIAPLKRDQLGRISSTAEQRAEVLAAFERSGLKGKAFVALAGINYQTFMGWLWSAERRGESALGIKRNTSAMALPPSFVEAVVAGSDVPLEQGHCLEVALPGGAMLRIASLQHVALAAQLLKALRSPC